jgi:hypothetical protein
MRGRNPSADSVPRPGAGGLPPSARMKEYRDWPKAVNPGGLGAAPPKSSLMLPP